MGAIDISYRPRSNHEDKSCTKRPRLLSEVARDLVERKMSNDCDGAPSNREITDSSRSTGVYHSASTSLLPEHATVLYPPFRGGDQGGQDLLDQYRLYDGFLANDDINYQDLEQLLEPPESRVYENTNHCQSLAPDILQPFGITKFSPGSGVGENWGTEITNASYGTFGAHFGRPNNEYYNKSISHGTFYDTSQSSSFQQRHRDQWQGNSSDEHVHVGNQSGDKTTSEKFSDRPQRPTLVALTSSEEQSTTSSTSSGSLLAHSTPDIFNASPPPVLKLRRGRPPLYPPLATYEFRPQIAIPVGSGPGGLTQPSIATPLSPVPTSPTSASATKPRRGRPPLYHRPPSTPKSSQEITRGKNCLAARRFRARQEAYMATFNAQVEDLELKNKDLKDEVAQLREQRLELRGGMLQHGKCGCNVMETYLQGETRKMKKSREDGTVWTAFLANEEQNTDEDKLAEI